MYLMAAKKTFDWDGAKQQILAIVKSNTPEDSKKGQVENFLKSLPFGIRLDQYSISYDACGYPNWATNQKIKSDSFKLREVLDMEFDPDTFETDYRCPVCKGLV
jgi:hypothetical protein